MTQTTHRWKTLVEIFSQLSRVLFSTFFLF
jgi:hypothetical protein